MFNHLIEPSPNQRSPSGRPSVMYSLPALYDYQDYVCRVPDENVAYCSQECSFWQPIPCDSDIFELCTIVSVELHLEHPRDTFRAVDITGNCGMLCTNSVFRLENTLDYRLPHLQRKPYRPPIALLLTTPDKVHSTMLSLARNGERQGFSEREI